MNILGLGCVISGVFGTGNGATSFSENIGAIAITRVASRMVMQVRDESKSVSLKSYLDYLTHRRVAQVGALFPFDFILKLKI